MACECKQQHAQRKQPGRESRSNNPNHAPFLSTTLTASVVMRSRIQSHSSRAARRSPTVLRLCFAATMTKAPTHTNASVAALPHSDAPTASGAWYAAAAARMTAAPRARVRPPTSPDAPKQAHGNRRRRESASATRTTIAVPNAADRDAAKATGDAGQEQCREDDLADPHDTCCASVRAARQAEVTNRVRGRRGPRQLRSTGVGKDQRQCERAGRTRDWPAHALPQCAKPMHQRGSGTSRYVVPDPGSVHV